VKTEHAHFILKGTVKMTNCMSFIPSWIMPTESSAF